MASPNAVFTEMVTTTLRNRRKEIADNVSKHNALYRKLASKDRVRTEDGGREIVVELDYAENGTYQRYSGYDTLNISASDVISAAKYDWKQAAIHITASGRELRQNKGRNRMINLVKSRVTNSKRTFANNMSQDLYSSGTLANQVGGLQAIIPTTGAGTVGGIDASTYTFWRNQTETATLSASNIKANMQNLWLKCVRGTDEPDMVVMENAAFAFYWDSLTDLQRYTREGDLGAGNGKTFLKFHDADVVHEPTDSGIPSLTSYYLNTDYLEVVVHRDANLTVVDEKVSTNQDAVVIPVIWQGNLVCSNRARQGILYNS